MDVGKGCWDVDVSVPAEAGPSCLRYCCTRLTNVVSSASGELGGEAEKPNRSSADLDQVLLLMFRRSPRLLDGPALRMIVLDCIGDDLSAFPS
jgi:hypothetical protein